MFDIYNSGPDVFLSDNYLVLDLETTNVEFGDAVEEENRLVITHWVKENKSFYISGSEYNQQELVEAVESVDFIVAHNAKFELKWLRRCGVDLSKVIAFDTMIAAYVLAGNTSRMSDLGLGKLSEKNGFGIKDKFVDTLISNGVCPSTIPESFIRARVCKDVWQTHRLFLKYRDLIVKNGLLNVFYTRSIFTPVLADIEFNGLQLDADRVRDVYNKTLWELTDVTRELNQFTGGINPKSSKQVCEFVYGDLKFKPLKDRQGNAIMSASKDVLGKLVPKTKRQRKFLELKNKQSKLSAKVDKSLKSFMRCIEAGDLLHAQFNQCVTKTHRLSSSGAKYSVQFQNLPREFKPLFKSRYDGWKIAEIDGAQLEFRVAAFVGQDWQAYYDITHDVDVHSFTASTLTEAGQETDRQGAKAHTFKPLYGGTSGTEAEKAYYAAFKEKYPGVASIQEEWTLEVLRSKKLRLASGLICYWPECKRTNTGYIQESSKIYNLPIQSLATADIIPIAITFLWHDMRRAGMKSFIVNTVHDSAIAEIHPDEFSQFEKLAVEAFSSKVYDYLDSIYGLKFNVPLGAGLKIGDHWGEADVELSSNIYHNSCYHDFVSIDSSGELKYTPPCKYEFIKEEAK